MRKIVFLKSLLSIASFVLVFSPYNMENEKTVLIKHSKIDLRSKKDTSTNNQIEKLV